MVRGRYQVRDLPRLVRAGGRTVRARDGWQVRQVRQVPAGPARSSVMYQC
ncbi:hypothetical protein ACFQ51_22640 [Streptomyces kaempferi]